jgi:hypothetical protein
MVAAITSECWPFSQRNGGRFPAGMVAVFARNTHLTVEEIELARDEIKAAIDHNLDIRDFLDEGLDAWEITRNL